ncbi:MAG: DNA polymerase III subunit gamma/tau [Firmicutes bacterium]|nr:DNA polymerase III subunit gamma/tau [Bacillota bacterium]
MRKALYRTLRPLQFKDVIDKDMIVTVLKNQIKTGNISHGYLFCGSRGTGKTSCAKIFSRAVNCLDPMDGEPCNKCKNCLEILEERAVDVLELDAASNNGVDNIRELRTMGVYPPNNLKKKVYIIDEAHMLSNSAFNALLKILEEPPSHLIFILATTDPDKIPDTVRSRLQRFDFNTINKLAIEKGLNHAVDILKEEVEPDVIKLIANESKGSMRDAYSMLDQILGIPNRPIKYKEASELIGITGINAIKSLLRKLINSEYFGVLKEAENLTSNGAAPEKILMTLMESLRDIYVLMIDPESEVLNREELLEFRGALSVKSMLDLIEGMRVILNELNYAFDKSLIFQLGLAGLIKDGYVKKGDYELKLENRNKIDEKPKEEQSEDAIKTENKVKPAITKENNKDPHDIDSPISRGYDDYDTDDINEFSKEDVDEDIEEELKEENQAVEEPIKEQVKTIRDEKSELDIPKYDESNSQNEEGISLFDALLEKFPMLSGLKDKYWVKINENKLIFTKIDPADEDNLIGMFEGQIKAFADEYFKKPMLIVKQNEDKNIEVLRTIFGDILKID